MNLSFIYRNLVLATKSFCIGMLCLCSMLPVFAQDGPAISKDDSIAFRKYLHIDMPLRTDVILLQNLYYSIIQEFELGVTETNLCATYNSQTGLNRCYDVPTVVIKKKLEEQFESLHKDPVAFEQGKQDLLKRLKAYHLEAKDKPMFFADIETKFGGNIEKYVDYLYDKSIMGNRKKFKRFMYKPQTWMIQRDPGFQFTLGLLLYEMALQGK